MADKVSATISYVDANNRKGMKAITDINPTADNGVVKSLCAGLNALTTNTLTGVEKIERTDITNATTKPKLTLSLTPNAIHSLRLCDDQNNQGNLFTEQITAPFTYKLEASSYGVLSNFIVNVSYSQQYSLVVFTKHLITFPASDSTATITIYFAETETTAATTAKIDMTTGNDPVLTIL